MNEEDCPSYHTKKRLSEFIDVRKGSLDSIFCHEVIKKYKLDPRKTPASTVGGVTDRLYRKTKLNISNLEEWKTFDDHFFNILAEELKTYCVQPAKPIQDAGYLIAHQDKEGYYHWHSDSHWELGWNRIITFIWYLNTLKDGHTEFSFGRKIKPNVGDLLLFPSNDMFVHRSNFTSSDKYICTGWIYEKTATPDNPSNSYLPT